MDSPEDYESFGLLRVQFEGFPEKGCGQMVSSPADRFG